LFLGALVLLSGCGGGAPSASWFGLNAEQGVVFLAANEQVFALNLESGAELWAFPSEPNQETGPFYSVPLLKDQSVVVGGFGDGKLYGLSQEGGTQQWVVETDAPIVDGAATTDGDIVVGNDSGTVYRVDDETQEKREIFKADKPIWASPLVDESNNRMYIVSMDHRLYAVDLEREEQVWEFEADGALVGTPALDEGVLYFGELNQALYAVSAETGEEIWRYEPQGWVWAGPLVHKDTVYFGDLSGQLHALDKSSGNPRWVFEVEGGIRATPLLLEVTQDDGSEALLYAGTDQGDVYAIDASNGTQRWSLPLNGAIYGQPVLYEGYLLIAPHNAKAKVVALDPESGAERWSYPPQEE
jgi:outer membrane protein assembly factor BamB